MEMMGTGEVGLASGWRDKLSLGYDYPFGACRSVTKIGACLFIQVSHFISHLGVRLKRDGIEQEPFSVQIHDRFW